MSEDIQIYKSDSVKRFQQFLNQEPPVAEVKVNKFANNSKFIGVADIERVLDEFTHGLWSTKNFRWEVIGNEISGAIDLEYFHPTAQVWITRTGSAAVQIQVEAGKPISIEHKIKNTLTKDFPHLKAECLKNAAKSLGQRFGRNLNRKDFDDEFVYLSDQVAQHPELMQDCFNLLESARMDDNIKSKWEAKIRTASASKLNEYIVKLKTMQS